MIKEIEYPSSGGPVAGVSWGAVFSGTFVAIAVMAALSLLGAGVGLASAPAADTAGGLAKGLGIGAIAWLIVSGIVSFYSAGWVTGRLTRTGIVSESVIHSAVTWAFATTAFLFLLTSAIGGALGGAASLLGAGAKAAAAGGGAYAARAPQSTNQMSSQVNSAVNNLERRAQANAPSREEVSQKAETADQAAGATGIAGFFLMLFEALACLAGGRAGTRVLRPRAMNAVRHPEPVGHSR